ncbi:hypothetical protein [Streptomyces sp. G-G2]|uniref:hypothetical protein n=1 Tax=Streptomyces sp. G-G2 TaxID=3046201 RepID=UPI0024B95C2B|nr:hypothetical protein [Streptomyces sp. G-G2]MDJ0379326.1 hypothetical protein [Streptomyces sp. G-G2]
MSSVRRTIVRATAVTACAGSLLALPAAAALADGLPAAASARASARAVAPQRILVKSVTLADGVSTAQVYRVAGGAYQADIMRGGAKVSSLSSHDGVQGLGRTDGMHLALQPDGRISSWSAAGDGVVPAALSSAADGHKTARRTGFAEAATSPAKATSDNTVAMRLGTLTDGPDDGVLLIAAGGGMAAVGAAGLGFAMLRRGRTTV